MYTAVVNGRVEGERTIESWLARDRGDGLRGSVAHGSQEDLQRAVTHVKATEALAGGRATVIECRLETGRTHQIRIHLAEAGHMLCGEKVYTHKTGELPAKDVIVPAAPRQALHSAWIGFNHPVTGDLIEMPAELPEDLRRWLTAVKGGRRGR